VIGATEKQKAAGICAAVVKKHYGGRAMSEMTRAERWFWVQTLLPMPTRPYFERSYDQFLRALPDRPLGAAELARLAYFAGAADAFGGLADHDKIAGMLTEEQARADLAQLALEPIEYLHRYGMKLG
jgi:hypothetical protein